MLSSAVNMVFRGLPRRINTLKCQIVALDRRACSRLLVQHSVSRPSAFAPLGGLAAHRSFHTTRCLAKKAAKGGKAKDDDSAPNPAPEFDSTEFDGLMLKAVDAMKKDFEKLRTGQVSAGMLDHVKVAAYGGHVPLAQVGQVRLRDPKTLVVTVFDQSIYHTGIGWHVTHVHGNQGNAMPNAQTAGEVVKALSDCGMNLSPFVENDAIMVPVPKMTKEYRESLVKKAKEMGESAKQSIRRARQKGMDAVKKISKAISKDDAKRFEKDVCEMYVKVQDHHDKHIKTVDDLVQRKAKAIME